LKRLGKVSHISSHKMLILRSEFAPRIGDTVFTKSLTKIGKVSDVFGPVSKPYVAIRPKEGLNLSELIGQFLYILPSFKKSKKIKSRRKTLGKKESKNKMSRMRGS